MMRTNLKVAAIAATWLAAIALAGVGQAIGANSEFDLTAAEEEAYWYSRYNLGHLTMRSGMGETFMPDRATVDAMIAMADADPNDGDTVSPPVNPALLRTVYAAGDPLWTKPPDPADFASLRWNPASFDTRVTGAALGWTIVKELEWAKQFHIDAHFGTPEDEYGAQWRFMGLVLTAMAGEQVEAWIELHDAGEMIMADASDPFVMLMAISGLADLLDAEAMPRSATNRYRDRQGAERFLALADEQFDRILGLGVEPMSARELAVAIQGLIWYASATAGPERQALALERVGELGELLIDAPKRTAAERAAALRGLIEVHRTIGSIDALDASLDLFASLADDFDFAYGIFASQAAYTIDDIASIVGGLNAARMHGGVDRGLAERILSGFFEAAVNLSGLQRSVPPVDSGKGAFEQENPGIFYGYPGIPLSEEVGEFGVAPVFASSVTFDLETGAWTEIDERFDTAGAMRAANEFIWLHTGEVNGFPPVEPLAMVAVSEGTEPASDMATEREAAERKGLGDVGNALIYLALVLVGLALIQLRGSGSCN